MDFSSEIKNELSIAAEVLNNFLNDDNNINSINKAAITMATSIKKGCKILSCGNGGSHCDAMHFAEELTGRYRENRPAYAAIAISDPSHISCVSNDFVKKKSIAIWIAIFAQLILPDDLIFVRYIFLYSSKA